MLYRVTTENGHSRSNGRRCYCNALVFSNSSSLFSKIDTSDIDEKGERHDKAMEQAQAEYFRKEAEGIVWLNEELCRQDHAVQTFQDVDTAIRGSLVKRLTTYPGTNPIGFLHTICG